MTLDQLALEVEKLESLNQSYSYEQAGKQAKTLLNHPLLETEQELHIRTLLALAESLLPLG